MFYEDGMIQTRIRDRGFEVTLNVMPEIGGEAIGHIFETIWTRLIVGKDVSLADVQELFELKKTRASERYLLGEDCEMDWNYIVNESAEEWSSKVVGVSILISGLYKRKEK